MAAKRDQRDKSFNYIFHEYTSSIVYRMNGSYKIFKHYLFKFIWTGY